MAEVASAYMSIMPSMKGLGRQIQSDGAREVNSAGAKLGKGFGKMFAVAGGALAAVGVASFLKDSISSAGDLEQSIGAIDTVFGNSSKKMHKWSRGAALDVGLTRNEFNELGTLIGSQLKNGGTAMDELAPKTQNLIGLGADLSSMFGGSTKEAVEALSSALKGERDPIERYGVSLNQAKIDAEAAALGFEKVDDALTDEAKQAATLSLIMKQTSDAHGNFAKESGTYAGQVQRLGAQWGNLKSTIGTAFLPVLTSVVTTFNERLMPALKNVADNVGPTFKRFKDAVSDIRGKLDFGPKLREIAETSWGKLQGGIGALKKLTDLDFSKIDGGGLGKQIGNAVRDGLSALGTMAGDLTKRFGELFGKVDWVGIGITLGKQTPALLLGITAGILNFDIGGLLKGIGDHWAEILLGVLTVAFAPAKLLGPVTRLVSKIPFVGPLLARAATWVNELGSKFTKFGGDLIRTFWRGFNNVPLPGAGFVARVLNAVKALPGQLKSFFVNLQTRVGVWALDAFEAMGRGARTATSAVVRFVAGIPGKILSAIGSLVRLLFPRGADAIEGMLAGIRGKVPAAVEFVKGIPGRLLALFGNAGTLLYNAGTQLMSGLARGIQAKIQDAINAVQAGLSKIKGMLPGSPIKWGPLKNWNNGGAGQRLMDLVTQGIQKGSPKTLKAAQSAFGKISDALTTERDNLRSTLDGLKGDFKSLAESVASAFTGNLFEATTGADFIANLMGKRGELQGVLASFRTLQGWGLDPKFLSQLFASGNGALITDLAAMGKTGASEAGALFGEVTSLGARLGNAVATNDPISAEIRETNKLLTKVSDQLSFLGSDIGKALNGAVSKGQRDGKNKGNK